MTIDDGEGIKQPRDYDLTCWYLNARRVMELVGASSIERYLGNAEGLGPLEQLRKDVIISTLKSEMTKWLDANKPPTLGQLIKSGNANEGQFFTHYSNFFFKGLNQVSKAKRESKPIPMAQGYTKLEGLDPGKRLTFTFSHEHLTSASAWDQLSGQKRMLFIGVIQETKENEIIAIPWIIANPMPSFFGRQSLLGAHWGNRLEVFTDEIEQFGDLREYHPHYKKADIKTLKDIPETDVKHAFAELLGVPSVPKDWGGETSDLFSPNLSIGGQRISTAFLFKGPAKFHPMTMADLGKNGDQINRLAEEPAELLVIQHCHEITKGVRVMMRAFAQQMGNLRLYCIIDAYETLRVLEANRKCGLSPREIPPRTPRAIDVPEYEGDEGSPEDYNTTDRITEPDNN